MAENINPNEPVDLGKLSKDLEARRKEREEAARRLNQRADDIQHVLNGPNASYLQAAERDRLAAEYAVLEKTLNEQYNEYRIRALKGEFTPSGHDQGFSGA